MARVVHGAGPTVRMSHDVHRDGVSWMEAELVREVGKFASGEYGLGRGCVMSVVWALASTKTGERGVVLCRWTFAANGCPQWSLSSGSAQLCGVWPTTINSMAWLNVRRGSVDVCVLVLGRFVKSATPPAPLLANPAGRCKWGWSWQRQASWMPMSTLLSVSHLPRRTCLKY